MKAVGLGRAARSKGKVGAPPCASLGGGARDTTEGHTLLLWDHPREPRCAEVPRDNFRRRGTDQREDFILPNALVVAKGRVRRVSPGWPFLGWASVQFPSSLWKRRSCLGFCSIAFGSCFLEQASQLQKTYLCALCIFLNYFDQFSILLFPHLLFLCNNCPFFSFFILVLDFLVFSCPNFLIVPLPPYILPISEFLRSTFSLFIVIHSQPP